eukprot:1051728-Pyramimonas_sp.AAC.1
MVQDKPQGPGALPLVGSDVPLAGFDSKGWLADRANSVGEGAAERKRCSGSSAEWSIRVSSPISFLEPRGQPIW